MNPSLQTIAQHLKEPPADFSFAPFWFWNDKPTNSELSRQMRELKAKRIDQAVIHARLGLRADYLSEEWFDRVSHCLKLAHKIGLRFWIYDEMNWPSGCAGGRVLERYPRGRARHIVLHRISGQKMLTNPMIIVPEGDLVAALLVSPDGQQQIDVSSKIRCCQAQFDPPGPDWRVYFIVERLDKRCHPLALPYQPDSLDPATTRLFDSARPSRITLKVKDYAAAVRIDCADGLLHRLPLHASGDGPTLRLHLEGFESLLILLTNDPAETLPSAMPRPMRTCLKLDGPWQIEVDGRQEHGPLRRWGELGRPFYSGTAAYQYAFTLPEEQTGQRLWLDLGQVHEIAQIGLDEQPLGILCWAPWRVLLPPMKAGSHILQVKVTNTPINELEQKDHLSGLLGPVRLMRSSSKERG